MVSSRTWKCFHYDQSQSQSTGMKKGVGSLSLVAAASRSNSFFLRLEHQSQSLGLGLLETQGDLASEAEAAGNWGELCKCHETNEEDDDTPLATLVPGPVPVPSSCPFRGCRAVELACGKGLEVQKSIILQDRVPDQR